MTDRPIIFNAPMVRSLLDGRKTQTRRLLSPQPFTFTVDGKDCDVTAVHILGDKVPRVAVGLCITLQKLRYAVGDRLYVREASVVRSIFSDVVEVGYPASEQQGYTQYVEQIPVEVATKAKVTFPNARPSIHMPRWASRLTLTVEEVRIERLQAISENDAQAEGVPKLIWDGEDGWHESEDGTYRCGFAGVWQHLYGAESWDANPWVVALKFKAERGNIDRIAS